MLVLMGLFVGWHFFKKDLANPKSKIVKPLITNQLKKMLNEASDSLYHLTYSKFDLDIDAGKGLITNLKLVPNGAVLKRLVAMHKAPNDVFTVTMDSLVIKNFGFVKTKNGRKF